MSIFRSISFILFLVPFQLLGQNVGVGIPEPLGQFHVSTPVYFTGVNFDGEGLNDMTVDYLGYEGDTIISYEVIVWNVGPNPNLFKWRRSGGVWSDEMEMQSSVFLELEIFIMFDQFSGHSFNDQWSFSVGPPFPNGLIVRNGKVGIGLSAPTAKLDVNGNISAQEIRLTSGAGLNRMLISDADGNGSWGYIHGMIDDDADTWVQLDNAPGIGDSICLGTDGLNRWKIKGSILEPMNTGGSILIGEKAGMNDDLTYNRNIAIGHYALFNSNIQESQVAIGDSALFSNGIGAALWYESTNNTAIGGAALKSNTRGYSNTAIGFKSLTKNINSINNTAIGDQAMRDNISGSHCTGIGAAALVFSTTAQANTAVGYGAQAHTTTGGYNASLGCLALTTNSTGSGNTAIGSNAMYFNQNGYANSAVGQNAMYKNEVGIDNVAVGGNALYNNTSGSSNIAVGKSAMYTQSFSNGSQAYFSRNIAIGHSALYYNQPTAISNGIKNVAIGCNALYNNTTGYNNVAVGDSSLATCNTGFYNIGIGVRTLKSLTNGNDNIALGRECGAGITTGDYNVGLGYNTYKANTTGAQNVAIGYNSQNANPSGSYNTSVGSSTNAVYNTFSNTTAIGYSASVTASNQVRLGSTTVESIGGFEDWSNISDSRFKVNVSEDIPGLSFINKLRPVSYNLNMTELNNYLGVNIPEDETLQLALNKKSEERRTGFLAQEVEQVAETLNFEFSGIDHPKNDDDLYSLRYAEFVVPLVKAVQELSAEIAQLKKENETLKEIVNKIEANLTNTKVIK